MDAQQMRSAEQTVREADVPPLVKAIMRAILDAHAFGMTNEEITFNLCRIAASFAGGRAAAAECPSKSATEYISQFAADVVGTADIDRQKFIREMGLDKNVS